MHWSKGCNVEWCAGCGWRRCWVWLWVCAYWGTAVKSAVKSQTLTQIWTFQTATMSMWFPTPFIWEKRETNKMRQTLMMILSSHHHRMNKCVHHRHMQRYIYLSKKLNWSSLVCWLIFGRYFSAGQSCTVAQTSYDLSSFIYRMYHSMYVEMLFQQISNTFNCFVFYSPALN